MCTIKNIYIDILLSQYRSMNVVPRALNLSQLYQRDLNRKERVQGPGAVTGRSFFVFFTSFFVFRIADLPHSPRVVYYHLLLRRETRIPGVAPFSFRIGNWDLFVHRGQKSDTPTAFGKLWTTPGGRCMKHASS